MNKLTLASALLIFASSSVQAGVLTDDLSRCMITKTTDADKIDLMRWMFAAVTKDPALTSMTTLTQPQRDQINKKMSEIYQRLIFVDCRSQAVAALKNDGLSALGDSGKELGGAAANKLLSSPAGQEELGKFGAYMDKKAWEALGTEAGVKVPDK